MGVDPLDTRPTLRAWLDEYSAIEVDYLGQLASWGIRIAPPDLCAQAEREAKARLRAKGALLRNGGASIVTGNLSSACVACTGGRGSKTFFLSLACNRHCYFCFNANQADYADHLTCSDTWRDEVDAFAAACGTITHVGLTGGEPLLHADEAVAFCSYVRDRYSAAHVRVYTAGDFLNESLLSRLRDAGLTELRMSIKLDDGEDDIDEALERLALAKRFIPDVMVEMPVVPGTGDRMRVLLRALDQRGVFGINLLEFCYPMGAWDEFEKRGFAVKNPPFPVLYNYGYAGGLPLAGSELLCLELMEFALDEGLSLGVHYCSLENKNCDQILQQNRSFNLDPMLYEQGADCFYHTAKVFDGDVAIAHAWLDAHGYASCAEEDGACLVFHPAFAAEVAAQGTLPVRSLNVVEQQAEGPVVRELKLVAFEEIA
ncbi:MAG: radical SAM protein [Gordonibacter sp.]|nr:radical SAM protein [Gordonibacter sp.]